MERDESGTQDEPFVEPVGASEFGVLGTFRDRDEEARFRAERLPDAATEFRQLCFVLTLGMAAYAINDVRLATGSQLALLLTVRVASVLYAIGIAVYALRLRSIAALDRLGLALAVPFVLVALWQDSTRPPDYFGHIGADVAIIFGIYLALPIDHKKRLGLALISSAGLIWMFVFLKVASDGLSVVSAVISILIANGLGLFVSYRLARSIRGEYALSKCEHLARVRLEKALSEVKTLSGLIPICASCKKVRNDSGFWEQVEVYVRNRSLAKFSHGICPECMKHYEQQLAD